MCMKLCCLQANGKLLCEVTADIPTWLPVRPKLNREWLRSVLVQSIRECFSARSRRGH